MVSRNTLTEGSMSTTTYYRDWCSVIADISEPVMAATHGNYYYRCAQRIYKFPAPTECMLPSVNAVALDTTVGKALQEFVSKPEVIKKSIANYIAKADSPSEPNSENKRLEKLIAKTEEEIKRYTHAYGQGMIDFDQFTELIKETKKRLKAYEKQLADQIKPKSRFLDPKYVNLISREVAHLISELDFSAEPEIIRNLINRVVIKDKNKVQVCGEFQLPNLTDKLGYELTSRDSRPTECGKVHVV